MKKYINIKIFKKVIILSAIIGIGILGINYTFCYPTTINALVAANVYSEPANSYFDDDNFYQCVVDAYNDENNASIAYTEKLSDEQLATITELDCNGKNIVSVNGLSKMPELTMLWLSQNQITEIDLSNNVKLKSLSLSQNKLTKLDVSKNFKLYSIYADHNELTEIDVSKNTELTYLHLNFNNITNIDVTNLPFLFWFTIKNNLLTEIDLTKNVELGILDIGNFDSIGGNSNVNKNEISFLDLSSNKMIFDIDAYGLGLNKIDFVETDLRFAYDLWFGQASDEMTFEEFVSDNYYPVGLNLGNNNLTSLDLSKLPTITYLDLWGNNLENIDLSKNLYLENLNINSNNITTLDISNNTQLKKLYANSQKGNFTTLDTSNNILLEYIELNKNNINSLDLTNNIKLNKLYLYDNELTELDLSNNTELVTLDLMNNNLNSLDLSSNKKIEKLRISGNSFRYTVYIYDGQTFSSENTVGKSVILPEETVVTYDHSTSGNATYYTYTLKNGVSGSFYIYYSIISIKINSDKYIINDEFIYVSKDMNNINLDRFIIDTANNTRLPDDHNVTLSIIDNILQVKSSNDIIKQFDVKGIDFGNLYSSYDYVSIKDLTSYEDFVSNIGVSDSLTYKLFYDDEEVTSGNVESGMILKVYYNDEEIDFFDITDEYLVIDESISVDGEYFNNISFNTTVDDILSKIDTTGEVTVKNKDNEVITGNNLIGTGSVVSIKLSKETYDYAVIIHGDVDGDGVLKLSDIMKIANYTYKNKNSLSGVFEVAADFDNNSTHNLQDIMKSAKALYGGK